MSLATGVENAPNPLLQHWDTPFGLPPFDAVRPEQFEPAFEALFDEHLAEIEAICQEEAPSFENTVAAFDRSGRRLRRIEALFANLGSSATSPALQAVELRMAPRLAAHASRVAMHPGLFARIDALHAQRDTLRLSDEQRRLLDRFHLDVVRAGAKLQPVAQQRYAQIMARLATLTTRFGQNVLADESSFRLVLDDAEGGADAAGLPEFARAAMRQAALDRGLPGGLLVTLSRSHVVPFLTFSERRDLREQAWRAWTTRGEHVGATDNGPVAREILTLRNEQARLHDAASYADHALADSMAGRQSAVDTLLKQVWVPAKARAAKEEADLQALAASLGHHGAIEPWDWRFYAEKLRQRRYALDETELKPYFPLSRMVEAVFDCARRLFGLRFVLQPQIAAYHPDVQVYEVWAADAVIGIFLHDNFARIGKRSGAWMSTFRDQSRNVAHGATPLLPIVINNNNFAKAAAGEATLLSFDDARTLFHEFGHGLHGLLSNVTYERLAGTSVRRDFVELPSQLFEHWLDEPEVLRRHARHHLTGARSRRR